MKKKKLSFFRKFFSRKKPVQKFDEPDKNLKSESSGVDSSDDICPIYSYETIISGKISLNDLDLERIEVKRFNFYTVIYGFIL